MNVLQQQYENVHVIGEPCNFMGWSGLCAEEKLLTFPGFVKYIS